MFRNLLLTLHQQFIEGHSQSERGRAYSYAPGFMFTPPPRPPVTLLFGHTRHYSKEVCADNTLPDALVCVSNLYRHQGVVVCWSETHQTNTLASGCHRPRSYWPNITLFSALAQVILYCWLFPPL